MDKQSFDVVIVGSGPVGCSFARMLHDSTDASILLLEAGPSLTDETGINVRNLGAEDREAAYRIAAGTAGALASHRTDGIAPRAGTYLLSPGGGTVDTQMPAAAMSANVGGMGVHWTCACPRPGGSETIDFIDPGTLEKAFRRAEDLLCVNQSGFAATASGDYVTDVLSDLFNNGRPEARRVQPMPLACRPTGSALPYWTGIDVILRDLIDETSPRFELRANRLARRLIREGDSVSGVEVEDTTTGERTMIGARIVIVAADPLRTPQLLWASGIRPAALGRYLNDQPQVVSVIELLPDRDIGPKGSGAVADRRDAMTGVTWIPFEDATFPFHGQVMQLGTSPVDIADESARVDGPVVGLGLFLAKEMRATDSVVLSEDRLDAWGMPEISIEHTWSDRDLASIERAKKVIGGIAERLGRFTPNGGARVMPAGNSLHYQGSHRIGPEDDGTSVCDPASRVWGTSNLFLGGNGNIPTETACNPTLTAVALAALAVDEIERILRS